MGNALLDESRTDPKQIYEQWLQQNPDLIGRKILAHNKLFQTNFFKYCEFSIKMSVFLRRDNTNIQDYLKAFQIIQNLVQRHKCIHILPMRIVEMKEFRDREYQKYTQNFTIGMRQYVHMTLEQKIEGRPTLTQAEKVWLIYQMIFAIFTCHDIFNIYHGNIRSSNFLVNRYQYLYLTDFASYKPVYIMQNSEQGLAEFRLFYSSSGQKCYLAPQKLVEQESSIQAISSQNLFNFNVKDLSQKEKTTSNVSTAGTQNRKLKRNVSFEEGQKKQSMTKLKQMDMFSLGLTILEVLNDGRSAMSYSELLKKRKQGMDFEQLIKDSVSKLSHGGNILQQILASLLRVIPEDRMNATKCLQKICRVIDQQMYHLLWMCLSAFSRSSFSSCDLRITLLYVLIDFIETQIRKSEYKWVNEPPRCLQGFNALKIFVELIQKHSIFSPKIQGGGNIIDKLMRHYEKEDSKKQSQIIKEQIIAEEIDQRRKFFINVAKQSKIVKRFSIALDLPTQDKRLCPPSIRQIEPIFDSLHEPIKLTKIGLRPPRQDILFQEYRQNQHIRQQKKKRTRYYKTSEIMIKVIFGCIRGCKYVASKLVALELMNLLGKDCGDEFRLHVMLPYFINLSEDIDLSVCRQAFFSFINLFYDFIDPFRKEEDIYYYEIILQYIVNIIRQSKNHKLRPTLFANFKQIFSILEWLEIHYKRFNRNLKFTLHRLLQVLKVNYGYFTKDQVKILLNGNIPEHFLVDMFEFYLSLINTDRLEGLKLSLKLARHINPLEHRGRDILEVFDSCVDGGLDEHGMGLVYAIQYFTLRKLTTNSIIKKIAPQVINPSKWVRDSALSYIKMCLSEYPPTKNFFFFKDIFAAPFPLKPDDINQEVLLPQSLKQSDIDWYDKKLKTKDNSLTINLFGGYLVKLRQNKSDKKRNINDEVERWNQTKKAVQDAAQQGKLFDFETYIKRQIDLLYEFNFLFYVLNLSNRYVAVQKEKDRPIDKSHQIMMAFRKAGWSIDYNSVDYQKKQIFERLQAFVNSSFEKHLYKRNRQYGEPVSDKIKIAQAIITIGEVLCKFEMFKIRPIPKLGTYIRQPIVFQKLARPKGVLVSQICEHTDTVTCIEKVADQFILSGSADGSLRMFDARKIQNNVTMCSQGWLEMRAQGEEKAKIAAVASFDQTYAAVVGSNRGNIRVYPIERFQKGPNAGKNDEIVKYAVGGELQKIITLTNQLKNECFCYITAEGNLGVQDIRVKSRAINCSIGRQRGIPRSLCATSRQSILVGTVDGYVMNFDIRFNVISSVFQLQNQRQTLPITNIVAVPTLNADANDSLFAFTYPSRHYQFCCFNLYDNKQQFGPQRQYISSSPEEIVSTPYFVNRTSDEQFKLCRNSLIWRKNYQQLRDFSKNFSIFDYLSDPLTRKQAKIREIWLDNSKNRYNQISSLYNKKNLPFLEFLHSGTLTSCNPLPGSSHDLKQRPSFALLIERKELMREQYDLERTLVHKPNFSHKVFGFSGQQTKQYFTCCKVLPNLVVAGCRNSRIKIYS